MQEQRVKNPFTPVFGGKPDLFFGRRDVIEEFDIALDAPGSEYRALFLTGNRGSGKTCLLEQLSGRAAHAGWDVMDLPADHALASLLHQLAPCDEVSETFETAVSAQALGVGGSVKGKGRSKTTHIGAEQLTSLFVEACARSDRGVFVSIDEMQKVPLDDISAICSAFQMASRKGLDAILVIAGLPAAYDRVIHHDGCTFMRRARHEVVGLLSVDEVRRAFEVAFGRIDGLMADDEAIGRLMQLSKGQPYLMQLLGYRLVRTFQSDEARSDASHGPYEITLNDVDAAFATAYDSYCRQALRPILDEAGEVGVGYLKAMVEVLDDDHEARTVDVASRLGSTQTALSRVRAQLIGQGVIVAPARGLLRFAVPYLRDYISSPDAGADETALLRAWDV